jgi:polysaccharide export outer membrane protein
LGLFAGLTINATLKEIFILMKSTTAFSLLFLSISQLTGCVFSPGQNLSVSGKKVISAEEANYQLDKRVEIFPLTPG